jgi:hypothetical protein
MSSDFTVSQPQIPIPRVTDRTHDNFRKVERMTEPVKRSNPFPYTYHRINNRSVPGNKFRFSDVD